MSRGRPISAGRCGVADPDHRTKRQAASDTRNESAIQIHCVGIGECDVELLRSIASATMGEVFFFGRKAKNAGKRSK